MSADVDVVVIGAGPYGLSIAAQLTHRRVEHRVVGHPMQFWMTQMPKGMLLKSEGFASNLYDSEESYTLARHCAHRGLAYADLGLPVPLQTFIEYGLAFQGQQVPHLEKKSVVTLESDVAGFSLSLDDGETFRARRVVVAIGVGHFSHVPHRLEHLPSELLTHSSVHHDLSRFEGKRSGWRRFGNRPCGSAARGRSHSAACDSEAATGHSQPDAAAASVSGSAAQTDVWHWAVVAIFLFHTRTRHLPQHAPSSAS
jgi:hypothetical protein